MPLSLLNEARRSLAGLRGMNGWQVELFLEAEETREVSWGEGKPKNILAGESRGGAVRALKNGRLGFAAGTDVSAEGVRTLARRARAAALAVPPDSARVFLSRQGGISRPLPLDPRLMEDSPEALLEKLVRLENRLLKGDGRVRKALRLSFRESRGAWAITSTAGVAAAESKGGVSFSAEILGVSGRETETAWGDVERRRWEDLDPGAVLADARARLLSSFGAEPLPSGRWPVILSPRVGVDFVGLTGEAVLGDAVFLGRSILHGRLGRRVGSPLVSLWDDGRRPGGVASRRWDAEGAPTRRTGVVRNGVLRAFLYDGLSARRAGARSTGNAVRAGRSAPPAPGITNFFLAPGRLSRRALYAGTPRAFVVWDVIGMHTADAASGDFSVGASGALWEKGRIRRAVRGVTLAGNLLDLWAGVDAVADDLTWPGAVGAPTFRVKELSLGGS